MVIVSVLHGSDVMRSFLASNAEDEFLLLGKLVLSFPPRIVSAVKSYLHFHPHHQLRYLLRYHTTQISATSSIPPQHPLNMYSVRSIAARRAPFVSVGTVQRAAFSQSIARCAGKESKLRT